MALGNVTATLSVPSRWQAGMVYTAHGFYNVGGAVAQNDTITFPSIIPANGVEIISTRLEVPKLDTNATPTGVFILGDANDDDRFMTGVSIGWDDETSHVMYDSNVVPDTPRTKGIGYRYSATSDLILKINTAVATAASSGLVALWVQYYCSGIS